MKAFSLLVLFLLIPFLSFTQTPCPEEESIGSFEQIQGPTCDLDVIIFELQFDQIPANLNSSNISFEWYDELGLISSGKNMLGISSIDCLTLQLRYNGTIDSLLGNCIQYQYVFCPEPIIQHPPNAPTFIAPSLYCDSNEINICAPYLEDAAWNWNVINGAIISINDSGNEILVEAIDGNDVEVGLFVSSPCGVSNENLQTVFYYIKSYYEDADGDGFGNPEIDSVSCSFVPGFVLNNQDCNDTNPDINPNATEIYNNGIDENCNGVDQFCSQGELEITRPENPTSNPNGPYFQGEKVNFCYSLIFSIDPVGSGNNCQWVQGIVPAIGNGWDLSLSSIENQGPGGWSWFQDNEVEYQVTSSAIGLTSDCNGNPILTTDTTNQLSAGTPLPGGWYYTSPGAGGCDNNGNPNTMWGLPGGCGSTQSVEFCFELTANTISDDTDCMDECFSDMSVAMFVFADGQTGCWSQTTCAPDAPVQFLNGSLDCDLVTVDNDGDGFDNTVDCNDNDPSINPGASELCDNIDNNCDGQIDEGIQATYFVDNDGDGFGDPNNSVQDCQLNVGFSLNNTDCDDTNPNIYEGATEIPNNGIDEDCDGVDSNYIQLGSYWYYQSSFDNGNTISYTKYEVIDSIDWEGKNAFVIQPGFEFDHDYIYIDSSKIFLWDQNLNEYVLQFDFSLQEGESYISKSGFTTDLNNEFEIFVDSIYNTSIDGNELKTFRLRSSFNPSFPEGQQFNITVYEGIGNDYINYRLPNVLFTDHWNSNLRCFGNNSIHYNFVEIACDSTWTTVASESIYTKDDINLYPNPTHNFLFIDTDQVNLVYKLYDINGSLIKSDSLGKEINLASLKSGVYVLKISSKEGIIATKRIVKI